MRSPKPPIPLPPRALGQRGSVIALALWGVASAHGQDPNPSTEAIIIELAEGPPSGDIYGGPPTEDREPTPEPWTFPSDFQGTWKSPGPTHTKQAHPAKLTITSDRYTLTRDGKTETGRIEVLLAISSIGQTELTYRVRMTERTLDSTPAPDASDVWTLNSTLTAFSTKTETFKREVVKAPVATKYGLPPDRIQDKDLDKDLLKD